MTFSDAVAQLDTTGITCKEARRVAATVAKDTLRNRKVPKFINRLRVRVESPCGGCTPDSYVTATSRRGKVTFIVRGGA